MLPLEAGELHVFASKPPSGSIGSAPARPNDIGDIGARNLLLIIIMIVATKIKGSVLLNNVPFYDEIKLKKIKFSIIHLAVLAAIESTYRRR